MQESGGAWFLIWLLVWSLSKGTHVQGEKLHDFMGLELFGMPLPSIQARTIATHPCPACLKQILKGRRDTIERASMSLQSRTPSHSGENAMVAMAIGEASGQIGILPIIS